MIVAVFGPLNGASWTRVRLPPRSSHSPKNVCHFESLFSKKQMNIASLEHYFAQELSPLEHYFAQEFVPPPNPTDARQRCTRRKSMFLRKRNPIPRCQIRVRCPVEFLSSPNGHTSIEYPVYKKLNSLLAAYAPLSDALDLRANVIATVIRPRVHGFCRVAFTLVLKRGCHPLPFYRFCYFVRLPRVLVFFKVALSFCEKGLFLSPFQVLAKRGF